MLGRSSALYPNIHRVERRAAGHEDPIALRTAEGEVADDFGQPNPAQQFARRIPARNAVIPDVAAGVAGQPDVAVDIAAHAIRPALDPVDNTVAEFLHV